MCTKKVYCVSLPRVIAIKVLPIGTDSDDDDASVVAVLSLATFDLLPVVGVACCCLGALALAVVDDLQRKEGFFWVHLFTLP